LAVFRRGADTLLARQAKAFESARPLRALWGLATDPRGTALLLEFMALANHRTTVHAELASYAERYRRTEQDFLSRLVETQQVDLGGVPPSVLSLLMPSIARTLVMEGALGLTTSKMATMSFVDEWLRHIEDCEAT
jgi:hypothetical protein